MFFDDTILEFVNGFSHVAICVTPSTFGSSQNHYQGNLYGICKLKLFSIVFITKVKLVFITKETLSGSSNLF